MKHRTETDHEGNPDPVKRDGGIDGLEQHNQGDLIRTSVSHDEQTATSSDRHMLWPQTVRV
jgi:hypothetical protein